MRLTNTALLALAASPGAAWKHTNENGFRKSLKENERTLVAFVEPSLESCKRLDVEWTGVIKDASNAAVLSIDCTQESKLCDEFDVASYPAIRLFHQDSSRGVHRYRGAREAPDLLAFLCRAARPVLSTVNDKNLTTLLAGDEAVFVARYAKTTSADDDDTLAARFQQLAHTYADRYTFAVSTDVASSPTVTCYRLHGELVRTAAELDASTTALHAFLETCVAPLVVDLTRRNELHYMGTGKSLVHYLYSSSSERRAYIREVHQLAQTYGEYLQFTTVDVHEYGEEMVNALGLGESFKAKKTTERGPLLAVQNPSNGDVFPFPATRSSGDGPPAAAVVEKFLLDIIQGTISPWTPGAEGGGKSHDEFIHCMHLNTAALIVVGGVCESQRTAEKTLKLLRQHAYVLEPPTDDDDTPSTSTTNRSMTTAFTVPSLGVANLPAGLTVHTAFVDKNLPGRLAHLSTNAQRRLVRLLYFWEKECTRWQRLVEEEEDLEMSLTARPAVQKGDDHRLQLLERVRRQRRLLPSERAGETTEGARGETSTAGPSSSSSRAARTPAYEDEPPPPYPGL